MAWMRQIAVFVLLTIFLGVNIGFGIYTHSCSLEGVERSYLIPGDDPCEDLHVKVEKTCCDEQEVSSDGHADEKNCCNTDTEYVQLDVDVAPNDYTVQFFISPVILTSAVFGFELTPSVDRRTVGAHCIHPPPRYQGRDLQCIHQVYRL